MVELNNSLTEFTDLGGFLSNVAPGVGTFIIVMAIFGGIAAIVYSVATLIKSNLLNDGLDNNDSYESSEDAEDEYKKHIGEDLFDSSKLFK